MQDPIKIIAAPVRRQILKLVWRRELTAGDIAASFTVSWPAVSQHLRVLRDSGMVEERREGRNRYYRANRDALGSIAGVLEAEWGEFQPVHDDGP